MDEYIKAILDQITSIKSEVIFLREEKKKKTQNNWKIIKLATIIVTIIVSIVKTVAIIKTIIVTMITTTAKKIVLFFEPTLTIEVIRITAKNILTVMKMIMTIGMVTLAIIKIIKFCWFQCYLIPIWTTLI